MRVIPISANLVGLSRIRLVPFTAHNYTHREVVCDGSASGDVALGHHSRSIHEICSILIHSMPVDGSRLVPQLICHLCDDSIAFCDVDDWERPLVVDADYRTRL